MKLLWLCNMMPRAVKEILGGSVTGGMWMDHVLDGLRRRADVQIRILCPGDGRQGSVDGACSYATFVRRVPHEYPRELEAVFAGQLEEYGPDVIHIWGTEYGHTLAMANAAEKMNMLDRTAVSIQGLCSIYAGHYAEGVPENVCRSYTFRDALRRDNIARQCEKYALRGEMECKALRKLKHVIGRTDWDRACTQQINPEAEYRFCNETLRSCFYADNWEYDKCVPFRIFSSSCEYPVKGFHYLLEAFGEISRVYPNATLAVTGRSFFPQNAKERLHQNGYEAYLEKLADRYGARGKIEFLGRLSAEEMKAEYLKANVFVLPSTIENSPNSLGEAMLLGVPSVAADVGGVTNLLSAPQEGYVYQTSAPYMLAYYVKQVFRMGPEAAVMGHAARKHAAATHDPEKNLAQLLDIYESLR